MLCRVLNRTLVLPELVGTREDIFAGQTVLVTSAVWIWSVTSLLSQR